MFSKLVSFGLILACAFIGGSRANSTKDLDYEDGSLYDDEGRLLLIPIGASAPTAASTGLGLFNFTGIAALLSVLASGLITLLGIGALGFLLWGLLFKDYYGYGSGSGTYGGGHGGGGYSSYSSYRRSFDPYAIDWEKFSILDWIAIGEETWRKFDPADLECQKRLICEIHQNTSRFGTTATRLVDLFSYLQYAEVLSLPDEIKALIEEYNDAADRGRSLQKDCGEVYTTCDFSVKNIMDKYSHNEI